MRFVDTNSTESKTGLIGSKLIPVVSPTTLPDTDPDRRHVFADLKPYICTFSGCKDELLTFPTRKLWEEHEFSQHRVDRSWNCSECPLGFGTPEEWRAHLDGVHRLQFNDGQFQVAASMAEKRTSQAVDSQQCPLCLRIPGKSRRNFITHVGKHLEGIALAVLPRENLSDSEADQESSTSVGSAFDDGLPQNEVYSHSVFELNPSMDYVELKIHNIISRTSSQKIESCLRQDGGKYDKPNGELWKYFKMKLTAEGVPDEYLEQMKVFLFFYHYVA